MKKQIHSLSSRYEAYKQGLLGVLSSALYGYEPLGGNTATSVELSANSVYINASRDVLAQLEMLQEQAIADSVTELQKLSDDDISSLLANDALTEMHSAIFEASKEILLNRMKQDARELITLHRNFRLKTNIRELQEEATQEHLVFSEREKLLSSFSPKQSDSLGRKYQSSFYVDRVAKNMAYRVHRLTMLFGLISLGHEYGRLQGGSQDGISVRLEDYFEYEEKVFHFASQALLMPQSE